MAVDTTNVAQVSTEPGELPKTMAAWVIREERQGEPSEAFQLEEMEVGCPVCPPAIIAFGGDVRGFVFIGELARDGLEHIDGRDHALYRAELVGHEHQLPP